VTSIACPRCKRAEITPLALVDNDRQRFQCNSCSENFTGPRLLEKPSPKGLEKGVEAPAPPPAQPPLPGFSYVPIAPPEHSDLAREAQPSKTCEKCGKPYYKAGKRFEEHVRTCDGTPFVQPASRRRALVQPSAAQPIFGAPPARLVLPQGTQKALEISIDALRVQRSVLEAEIAEIDRTIMNLEKLKGLGGEPSVPFTESVPPSGTPSPPPSLQTPEPQPAASEPVSAAAGA
jgi:hypothetical protein